MTAFELVLVYLLAAVLGVVIFRSFRLPPMLGYLAVGVVIGPHVLGMIQRSERIAQLAEMGVVLLMFVIGLEFSLPKLRTMRRHVFGLGLLQVVLTMAVGTAIMFGLHWLLPRKLALSWHGMLALSAVLAMSSTAIVVKLMAERFELDSEHGKRVMGVLLFQDLAVVPLLILIPALAAHNDDILGDMALALAKGVTLIAVLLVFGPRVMKRWMYTVASRKSEELFMLNVLLVTLGLAWLTERVGLSLALGAFIAGMLVSETPYKHQVESDIRPFHDLLLGLFFITVGMLLDWHEVLAHWALVLVFLLVPLLVKAALIWLVAWVLRAPGGVALRTGLYLAQAGEFGFVLLNIAAQGKLLPAPLFNAVLASMVLSMVAAPFIIQYADALVQRLVRSDWMDASLQITHLAQKTMAQRQHVIICGYGRTGQAVARMLTQEKIPFVALDMDPDRVRQASRAGDQVAYGDATRTPVLVSAGLARARAVIITFTSVHHAMITLGHIRQAAVSIPTIVRTHDDRYIESLRAAGATEVVPEVIEGTLMLGSHALALMGVPVRRVLRTVQQQRAQRYGLLRGFFRGADDSDDAINGEDSERLTTVAIDDAPHWIGQPLGALQGFVAQRQVEVLSLRRADGSSVQPEAAAIALLAAGDIAVLRGMRIDLADAEDAIGQKQ